MARFDDYHRTVVGYHGTGLTAALRIVNRIDGFRWSKRVFDWLGGGIYFWEYAPKQALNFAKIRQRQYRKKRKKTDYDQLRATESLAVVACMIRLGFCLDLTEPENVEYVGKVFEYYKDVKAMANAPLPKNKHHYRKLDCEIFNLAYKVIEDSEPNLKVDTARGVYVPTDDTKRIWEGSWISRDTHVQILRAQPSKHFGFELIILLVSR